MVLGTDVGEVLLSLTANVGGIDQLVPGELILYGLTHKAGRLAVRQETECPVLHLLPRVGTPELGAWIPLIKLPRGQVALLPIEVRITERLIGKAVVVSHCAGDDMLYLEVAVAIKCSTQPTYDLAGIRTSDDPHTTTCNLHIELVLLEILSRGAQTLAAQVVPCHIVVLLRFFLSLSHLCPLLSG